MKTITKRIGFSLLGMLIIIGVLTVLLPQSILSFAKSDNHEHESEYVNYNCSHDHNQADFDILEGYQGLGYNVEEMYLQANETLIQTMNASVSNPNTCNSITSSHGPGRENGNATNFLSTGCGNYSGYSYTYGTTTIPFFMDETNMTTDRAADVRAQIAMWNQSIMHDGTGQIANLYEVNNRNNVNGRPVVVVSQANLDTGIAGLFTGSKTAPTVQVSSSMNVDTPMHEFGHLLGLNDLESSGSIPLGTHKVLMGYSRETTTATLSSAIKYQDIQGIARVNGRHTTHQFSRYVMNGGRYSHFCFYCDTVDDVTSAKSGSSAMVNAANCIHNYQPMVSHGDRHWQKCTKCYKVVESEFTIQGLTSTTLEVKGLLNINKTSVLIPSDIGGQSVTSIGASAFANSQLSQITIPASVTNIGNAAFKNCFNLTSVSSLGNVQNLGTEAFSGCNALTNIAIPNSLTNIGEKAFAGCNNLNVSVASSNPNYSAQNNMIYNKAKTILISAHKISAEVSILNTVSEILPYAFENNHNLYKVYFNNNVTIGKKAFANNLNLSEVYFYSFDQPTLGANSFSGNDFTLFAPYNNQASYSALFGDYTNNVTSPQYLVNYISNNETVKNENVYYGSTINLYTPQRAGYDFDGWYNNNSFSGDKYQNGDLWTIRNNQNIYAKWNAKSYTVTLDSNDGVLNGSILINVIYDQAFSTPTTATRIGYTFEGWYDSLGGGTKYITEAGQGTRAWDKTSNTTLYARWAVKSYEIQINDNGTITWLGESGLSNVECSIPYGTVLTSINLVPTFKATQNGYKEGKIFDHFKLNNEVINWESIPDLGNDASIITITPIWILESHTIYFNTQTTQTFQPKVQNCGTSLTLPTASTNGKTFKGWYTSSTGGTKINWTTMPDLTPLNGNNYSNAQNNGSTQLYAQYNIINYFITYNLDSGVNSTENPSSYNINSDITFKDPAKTGHRFDGWFLDSNKTNRIIGLNNDFGAKNIYAKFTPQEYTINLDLQGGTESVTEIRVVYNQAMPKINEPKKYGYAFLGYWTERFGKGVIYYDRNINSVKNWDIPSTITLYADWVKISKDVGINYIQGSVSDWPNVEKLKESHNLLVVTSSYVTAPDIAGYTFQKWDIRGGYPKQTPYIAQYSTSKTIEISKSYIDAVLGNYKNYDLFAIYKSNCIAEGSLITLADGSQKAVENLTGNEMLLVWNLKTGQFDTAPILFIDSDLRASYEVINLYFSDGTTVKVISEHGFWNIDLNKYVFLRNDAAQYLGHWFNKQITDANGNMTWVAVQLTNVVVANEVTTSWSPVTYEYLCYYVNGMLSMPGATTGLINIFKVDAETMQYDQELMLADIEEFGLFTYEEFAAIIPVPQEIFDAFDAQYLKVAIGKGLVDWDTLASLIENYSKFFNA